MNRSPVMVGLGELLWDLLPGGKVLGGAPANFAYMAKVLGNEAIVASRVGDDDLGREACQLLQELELNTAYVQRDDRFATGTAGVSFQSNGQPHFIIKESVAWDFLQWSRELEELAERTDVVCFGSLAQRSTVSATTIEKFLLSLPKTTLRIFDANLRAPFYSADTLHKSFQYTDIAKVNSDELLKIAALMKLEPRDEMAFARWLVDEFGLKLVCITRGDRGSILVSTNATVEHTGFSVKVADTIGAGDAFTACLAHYYVRGESLDKISDYANRIGSWVASQVGATPFIPGDELRNILSGAE